MSISSSAALTLRVSAPDALQQFRAMTDGARALKNELAALQSASANSAGNASPGVARLRAEVQELGTGLKAARAEIDSLSSAQARSTRQHLDNAGAANKHSGGVAQLRNEHANLQGVLRGTAGALDGLWLTYGKAMVATAAAFATIATIRESLKQGTEYDYTLSYTAALSDEAKAQGVGSYKRQIDEQLRAAAGPTQFSAGELAKGLRVLEQTGIDASKGVSLIGTAAQAALMGEVDLKTATQDLVNVLEVFKLRSDDPVQLTKNFKRAGDVIATVAKETKANFHEVAESLKGVVGVTTQYGVQLETAAAIVEKLGKAGIVGGKAGTFTRNLLENLYSNTSTAARQTKNELGLTPFDGNGGYKNDVAYISEAITKLRSLNTEAQNVAIGNLFNERGGKPARELVFALNELGDAVERLKNSKGSLADFAKSLEGVAKVEWQKTASRWDDLLTGAFKGAEGSLIDLAKGLQGAFADPDVITAMTAMLTLAGKFATVTLTAAKGWGMITGAVLQQGREQDYSGLVQRRDNIRAAQEKYGDNDPTALKALAETEAMILNHPERERQRKEQAKGIIAGLLANGTIGGGVDREISRDNARIANDKLSRTTTTGSGSLSSRLMDPDAARREQEQVRAGAREDAAQIARTRSLSEVVAQLELSDLDRLQRAKLISEEQYTTRVEAVNRIRITSEVEEARKGILALQAEREKMDPKNNGGQRDAAQTRINDAVFKLQEMNVKALSADKAAGERIDGINKKASLAYRDEALNTTKITEKLKEREELARAQSRIQHDNQMLSAADAAAQLAAFDTRKRFAEDALKVEDEIRVQTEKTLEFSKQGADGEAARAFKLLDLIYQRRDATAALGEVEAARNAAQARAQVGEERTFAFGWNKAFKDYSDSASDNALAARDIFATSSRAMEVLLAKMATGGIRNFRDLGDAARAFGSTVVQELINIQARKVAAGIMGEITNGFPLIGSLLGGGGTTAPLLQSSTSTMLAHTGGVVGALTASRSASPSLFAGAPRFHTGGLVGDERPIIARLGEGIFTREQMAALAPAGDGGSSGVQINININAQTGQTDSSASGGGNADSMKMLGERMAAVAREEIQRQQRPNGLLAGGSRR